MLAFVIPYYGIFVCDTQVSDLHLEINHASGDQSLRGVIHYEITIGNDVSRDAHYDITMGNDITRDIFVITQ